jgi:hypothetical protein
MSTLDPIAAATLGYMTSAGVPDPVAIATLGYITTTVAVVIPLPKPQEPINAGGGGWPGGGYAAFTRRLEREKNERHEAYMMRMGIMEDEDMVAIVLAILEVID